MKSSARPPPPRPDVQRAFEAHRTGRLAEAHRLYRAALMEDPADYHANHLLGTLMHQTGRHDEAERLLRRAIDTLPEIADPWCNLGSVHRALGRLEQARQDYDQALAREPELAAAWLGLGNVQQERGAFVDADRAYRKALALDPDDAQAHFNRAALLARMGRLEESTTAAQRCLALDPALSEAYALLAENSLNAGNAPVARNWARRGLEHRPHDAELWHSLGFALSQTGELIAASEAFERCLAEAPEHGGALAALLFTRRRLADWRDLDRLFRRFLDALDRGVEQLTPFSLLAEPSSRRQQRDCARLWTRQLVRRLPAPQRDKPRPPTRRAPGDRLTIGYLSADYYRHPTAFLAAGLFEEHDRDRFRVVAYSTGPDDGSGVRRRLESAFDEFVDLRGQSATESARRIEADDVDILVDLKGHTLDAATAVTALRPAPVLVHYLGYPGTMGAGFCDYIIGDAEVTPFAHAEDYDEHIVQLPHSYQVNDRRRPRPTTEQSRADLGLPARGTVFCCFNNSWKIGPESFDAWMHILRALPDSVLWILGRESMAKVSDNLRREARRRGVDAGRLVFSRPRPMEAYLALYHHADLFLDTLPYNAHTTASDALWMGCPVLTARGETFASRVGASLLRAVDLPELICDSLGDYIEVAIELAREPSRLRALRSRLERDRLEVPLFDTRLTTRHLESAYREMWRQALAGEMASFRVSGSGEAEPTPR